MKNFLIIALLLCGSMSATGQMVRNDSLLMAAAQAAAAKTNARYADQIARLTDCSNIKAIIKTLKETSSSISIPSRYMVRNGRSKRYVFILSYDSQNDSFDYSWVYISYKRPPATNRKQTLKIK